jgi:pimeloyl-ACP methyl ester carboxylesterase
VVERLSRYRTVVNVDLPHHGESDQVPLGPDTFAEIHSRIAEFVQRLSARGPVHVAGNSLGGFFALDLAARGCVASATALSPAGFGMHGWDGLRVRMLFSAFRQLARRIDGTPLANMDNVILRSMLTSLAVARPSRVPAELARIQITTAAASPLLSHLIGVRARLDRSAGQTPVTVAWGKRDLILPVRQIRRVRDVFPDANLIVIPGAGHIPMSDNPALLAAILLAGSAERAPVDYFGADHGFQFSQTPA